MPETRSQNASGRIEIRIPQLGEGLQEARILRFLKQPGERVAQDEPLFEMETDKAIMEIESPAAGVVAAWSAEENDVLPIGAVIGALLTDTPAPRGLGKPSAEGAGNGAMEACRSAAPARAPSSASTTAASASLPTAPEPVGSAFREAEAADSSLRLRNALAPPRTRAYARAKGLTDSELLRLAQAAGRRLLPEDIDRYLREAPRGVVPHENAAFVAPTPKPPSETESGERAYTDVPITARQRTLIYRLQRGTQAAIPATLEMVVEWSALEAVRSQLRRRRVGGGNAERAQLRLPPTPFLLFAWCVAQTARTHPAFRSALINDSMRREYAHLHLGVAVARPGDDLVMARIENADTLSLEAFIEAAREAIHNARRGIDQTSEAMQVSLTNLASSGVRFGIPVVAAPAVATIFLGAPYDEAYPKPDGGVGFRRLTHVVMTFDHRLVNGVGAARFLNDIRTRAEGLREEFASLFASG